MKYKIRLTKKARGDFLLLQKKVQIKIAEKFRFYIFQDNPLKYSKKLQNSKFGTYRFRIGDYRAIFDIDKLGRITILFILRIKHRKDIYLR